MLRERSQYPVPHDAPLTPRPQDWEFLKIRPPLRALPELDGRSRDLGMARWWRDCGVHIFSEQAPTDAELAARPVVRTTSGEDEPLVLGLWGLRHVGMVTVRAVRSPFPIAMRRVEFNPRRVPGENFGDRVEGGPVVGFANYLAPEDTGEVLPDHSTVFWLTVQVPPGARPGRYQADVVIEAPGQTRAFEESIAIEVLDCELPRADIAFGMCFRRHVKTFGVVTK